MAIKKEKQTVNYVNQIQVARATGFEQTAASKNIEAKMFDELSSKIAQTYTNYLQTEGRRTGEERAAKATFTIENRVYGKNPDGSDIVIQVKRRQKTPDDFKTRTEADTYRNKIAERYVLETKGDIEEADAVIRDSILNRDGGEPGTYAEYEQSMNLFVNDLVSTIDNPNVKNLAISYAQRQKAQSRQYIDNIRDTYEKNYNIGVYETNQSNLETEKSIALNLGDFDRYLEIAKEQDDYAKANINNLGAKAKGAYDAGLYKDNLQRAEEFTSVMQPLVEGMFTEDDPEFLTKNLKIVDAYHQASETFGVNLTVETAKGPVTITSGDFAGLGKKTRDDLRLSIGRMKENMTKASAIETSTLEAEATSTMIKMGVLPSGTKLSDTTYQDAIERNLPKYEHEFKTQTGGGTQEEFIIYMASNYGYLPRIYRSAILGLENTGSSQSFELLYKTGLFGFALSNEVTQTVTDGEGNVRTLRSTNSRINFLGKNEKTQKDSTLYFHLRRMGKGPDDAMEIIRRSKDIKDVGGTMPEGFSVDQRVKKVLEGMEIKLGPAIMNGIKAIVSHEVRHTAVAGEVDDGFYDDLVEIIINRELTNNGRRDMYVSNLSVPYKGNFAYTNYEGVYMMINPIEQMVRFRELDINEVIEYGLTEAKKSASFKRKDNRFIKKLLTADNVGEKWRFVPVSDREENTEYYIVTIADKDVGGTMTFLQDDDGMHFKVDFGSLVDKQVEERIQNIPKGK